jgi:hypothetical protein
MGFPMLHQAIGRVRRLGQKSVVKVYDYHLVKSFDIKQLSNNVSKVLPALAMQINNADWNLRLDKNQEKDKIEITLDDTWVQNKDHSISRLRLPFFQYIPRRQFLTAKGLLTAILNALSSSIKVVRDKTEAPKCVEDLLAGSTTDITEIMSLDDQALVEFLKANYTPWEESDDDTDMTDEERMTNAA